MSFDVESSGTYGLETDWFSVLASPDRSMHRHSISSTTIPVLGEETGSEADGANPDFFDPVFSWTNSPRTDITSPYVDSIHHHQRSKSYADPTVQPSLVSGYEQPDSSYSASAPGMNPGHNVYMSNATPKSATCNCFNTCLSALQALHNSDAITATSPFDVILTVNQRAVETCSTMLNCPICTSKSGSSLRTMLLGTILGRIISIYQEASHSHVRWLQMEIILRDLKKLKELFAKFQETSMMSESEEDAGMHGAVTNYLCQSLNVTFELLEKQRDYSGGHE
ncbi:hypothetical protein BKA64DRAFT_708792 [Cadophora sp. MPI-SDFR-AT-0126]|nr:hypothetical protein BKA64DRAFT_708792 [Leotiomycetes sp. MPI-SDFR-AT-0126]